MTTNNSAMDHNDKNAPRRYPGARSYSEKEARLFCGREEDATNLHERIRLHNLNVLYGKSGMGKSSLLGAGLLGKLHREENVDIVINVFGSFYRENTISLAENLVNTLRGGDNASATFLSEKFSSDSVAWTNQLWLLLKNRQIAQPAKDTFVLIFDKFEEIFSYPQQDVLAFKKLLSELLFVKVPQEVRDSVFKQLSVDKNYLTSAEMAVLFNPLNVKILFAIDADKLSLLNNFADFFPGILQSCYEIRPLTRSQATSVIVSPAAIDDPVFVSPTFTFTPEVIELILSSLSADKDGNADAQAIEPFQLQLVCRHAEDIVIETGDTEINVTDLGNINEIFDQYYINIIRKLPPPQQLPARRLIEEKLVVGGSRVTMPVPFILMDEGMSKELLSHLVDAHILNPVQNNMVEISHDTFLKPILRYYDERKKEELIAAEEKKKDEQIRKLKEEQQAHMQMLEAQRAKARMKLAVRTGSIVVLLLLLLVAWQRHIKLKEDELIRRRSAAYQVLGQARKARNYDPTAARIVALGADTVFTPADDSGHVAVRKFLNDMDGTDFYYRNAKAVRPGSYVGISGEGTMIVTGNIVGRDSLWSIDGRLIRTIRTTGLLRSAGFSHNGRYVILCTDDWKLKRWDIIAHTIQDLDHPESPVTKIQYSPDDKHFLTLGINHKVTIFDSSGKVQSELDGSNFLSASFSRNSDTLITGSSDGVVYMWNIRGDKLNTYSYWGAPISALAFTPHGGRFVTVNQKGFASMWHKNSKEKPLISFGDLGSLSAALVLGYYKDTLSEVDPRNNSMYSFVKVATGDTAGSIKIWLLKYASGDFITEHADPAKNLNMVYWYNIIAELKGHKGRIDELTKLNDSTIVSCSADHTVKSWNIGKVLSKK